MLINDLKLVMQAIESFFLELSFNHYFFHFHMPFLSNKAEILLSVTQ